jgi:hypothetical protein
MPPKPRQLRAPWTKQSGNAFQALVDLPEDGSNSTFDERDGKVDESDGFSAGNMIQRAPSAASEAPQPPPRYTTDYGESPVRKWRTELVNDGVRAHVFGAEIDCSAENILQYCAANAAIRRSLYMAMATPPLRSQQRVPKPSIFPSDSDLQHSFTYLCEFPENSRLISLIFVAKSEFSCVLAYPTTRNATKTSPTPRPTAQTVWERVPSPCGPS